MELQATNERQMKFIQERLNDESKGEKWLNLIAEHIRVLQALTLARDIGLPADTMQALTSLAAEDVATQVNKQFPSKVHPNPAGVQLRFDMVEYLQLCDLLDPSLKWNEAERTMEVVGQTP